MNHILTKITLLTSKAVDELENLEISDYSKVVCYKGLLNDLLSANTQHLIAPEDDSIIDESVTLNKSMLTSSLYARIDPELAKRFKKKLIDENLTYQQWLTMAIDKYLKEKACHS